MSRSRRDSLPMWILALLFVALGLRSCSGPAKRIDVTIDGDTVEVAVIHDSSRVDWLRLSDSTVHVDGVDLTVRRKR